MKIDGNTIKEHIVEHEILGVKTQPQLDIRYLKLSGGTLTGNLLLTDGRVGIGTESPEEKLDVNGNVLVRSARLSVGTTSLNPNFAIEALANETATTGEKRALSFSITGNPTADWGNTSILGLNGFAEHQANYNALGAYFGGFFGARNSGTSTLWTSFGAFLEVQNTSTGTCNYAVGAVASIKDTGGGKFNNAYGLMTQGEVAAGGTITNFHGAYIKNPTGDGAVTNNYGLYIENQNKGGTNYSIYSAGGANYFVGSLQTNAGFGCNTKAPQVAYASGGAVTTSAGSYGFGSDAERVNLTTLVSNIRTALVNNGIMS